MQVEKHSKFEVDAETLQNLLQSSQNHSTDDEIDLAELWRALMRQKWLIIVLTGLVTITVAVVSALMTPKYEASVTLIPVSAEGEMGGLAAKYGGLASLAGISLLSGGGISLTQEAIVTLQSKRFLADFILEKELKKVLFYKNWDAEKQQWIVEGSFMSSVAKSVKAWFKAPIKAPTVMYEGQEVLEEGEPSVYEAVDLFANGILSISEDAKSGLTTLKIKWNDPVLAQQWAMELVERIDIELRQKALADAQLTIDYMNQKLPTIELQELRSIALQMIEENIKKITFAEVKKEYVFKVIDPAIVASDPISPKKGLMVAVGLVLGLMLSVFLALILNWRSSSKGKEA
jgi:LPS O-antigen subunit length determinant protein (WzzB/FepE family)